MKFIEDLSKLREFGRKKEKDRLPPKTLMRIYRVFGRHYKKYWKILTVGYLALFATIGVTLLTPWPLKLILDYIIIKEPLPSFMAFFAPLLESHTKLLIVMLGLAIVLLAILEACFSYINKFWISSTGQRMTADIRERIFAHLQRLSLSFHESSHSGDLVYLMTNDVNQMKNILIDFLQDISKQIFTFVGAIIFMLALDWRLALIAVSTSPILYFVTRYFGAGMQKAMRKKRGKEGEISAIISENVTAMALVQAYGREHSERDRFSKEVKASLKAQMEALRLQKTFSRLSDFTVTLSSAGVLYFGGLYALGGSILPGTLVVFVAYLRDIYGAIEKFNGLFLNLAKSAVSSERILELVENDMVMADAAAAVAAPTFKGRIEFKNVRFAYKKGKDVLKNLSFVIEPGENVALVGHSGAGKSTLISLLLRFYDPQEGQILIDGQDIRNFTLRSLREQITIVLQDAPLFRQTVRENIAFGKIGATEEEIVAAAKQAQAHEFIMQMPEGYESMALEGGNNLSGGQKQRLNLARAIIRNTPIVILDEPLTGLDARAEALVKTAIDRLIQGKSSIIVAHKFSTIVRADKILLLEDGQLAHFGKHEQLLRESAAYRELYELRFGGASISDQENNRVDGKLTQDETPALVLSQKVI
jgi:ABC-type multidrug transport system fused ATPase/permease subunit